MRKTEDCLDDQLVTNNLRDFGVGKTIMEIINSCDEEVIGVKNLKTGTRAKVCAGLYRNNGVYNGKLQGYLGIKDSAYYYYPDRKDIFYWYQREWVLEWAH